MILFSLFRIHSFGSQILFWMRKGKKIILHNIIKKNFVTFTKRHKQRRLLTQKLNRDKRKVCFICFNYFISFESNAVNGVFYCTAAPIPTLVSINSKWFFERVSPIREKAGPYSSPRMLFSSLKFRFFVCGHLKR